MPSRSPIVQAAVLLLLLASCYAVAGLGAAWTFDSVRTWYPTLNKPTWTPPSWVFGPVWSALYTAMAVAAWLVWRRAGWVGGRLPLGLFAAQLALNLAWSLLFFGLRRPDLGLLDIVALLVAIMATGVAFAKFSKPAAALMVPYLAWVSFATALNASIWRLNG